MIPTRLLTILTPARSVATATETAYETAAAILDDTDATFYRGFDSPSPTVGGRQLPTNYKPPSQPVAAPLFESEALESVRTGSPGRFFDELTATNPQLEAFDNAMGELLNSEQSTTPLAAALTTVALSKTAMQFENAVRQHEQHSLPDLAAEANDSDALPADDSSWYLGTGDQHYHPDLNSETITALATSSAVSEAFDEYDVATPYQHLLSDDQTPLTSFGAIADYLNERTPHLEEDETWWAVPVDVGIA